MKRYWYIAAFVSVALLLLAVGKSEASIPYTLTPVADGYGYVVGSYYSGSVDTGYAFQVGTSVIKYGQVYRKNTYRSALKFDLSSIPDGSVIESAFLTLYGGAAGWTPASDTGAQKLFPVQLKYSDVDTWINGSVGPINDPTPGAVLDAQPIDVTDFNYRVPGQLMTWNLLANNNWQYGTDLLDDALTLILMDRSEDLTIMGVNRYGFNSSEDPLNPGYHPQLVIVVSDPSPAPALPEPTTLIIWSFLGALGIVGGWWRRKRAA